MRHLAALALIVAASPVAANPADDAQRVEVTLKSFGFVPAMLTLHHGHAYVLHLTNTASGGHDFAARAFFAAARVDAADQRLVRGGSVEVGGGEAVDVHLVAPAPGRYTLKCTHFLHTTFGMKETIIVD